MRGTLYRLWVKAAGGQYHVYTEAICYARELLFGVGHGPAACGHVATELGVLHTTEGIPPGEAGDRRCEKCVRTLTMMELAE